MPIFFYLPAMPHYASNCVLGDFPLGDEVCCLSAQSYLCSCLDKPNSFSLSSQNKCSSTTTSSRLSAERDPVYQYLFCTGSNKTGHDTLSVVWRVL